MWDTLRQSLPLIMLAMSATAWMVRDIAHSKSTGTPRRPKARWAVGSTSRVHRS